MHIAIDRSSVILSLNTVVRILTSYLKYSLDIWNICHDRPTKHVTLNSRGAASTFLPTGTNRCSIFYFKVWEVLIRRRLWKQRLLEFVSPVSIKNVLVVFKLLYSGTKQMLFDKWELQLIKYKIINFCKHYS